MRPVAPALCPDLPEQGLCNGNSCSPGRVARGDRHAGWASGWATVGRSACAGSPRRHWRLVDATEALSGSAWRAARRPFGLEMPFQQGSSQSSAPAGSKPRSSRAARPGVNRSMLTASQTPVGTRVKLHNEIREPLKASRGSFEKLVGGFTRRAERLSKPIWRSPGTRACLQSPHADPARKPHPDCRARQSKMVDFQDERSRLLTDDVA